MLNTITDAVLQQVETDRRNEPIDTDLLKQIVSIYTFLSSDKISGISVNCLLDLEEKQLAASRTFFQTKASQMIQSYTLVDYLQQADLLLQSEKTRLEKCLCWPNFDQKLLVVFQEEILIKYQTQLLNNEQGGIRQLFYQNNFEDLKLLYRLYSPLKEGLKPIADRFKQQLTEVGKALIQTTETTTRDGKEKTLKAIMTDSQLIEKIINTLTKNRQIITECFQADTLFEMQLQLSFQDFLNHDVGKYNMSELLAYHADKILRKGGVKGEKKVLEESLDNLAQIFTYLYDKDLFLVVYRT